MGMEKQATVHQSFRDHTDESRFAPLVVRRGSLHEARTEGRVWTGLARATPSATQSTQVHVLP